MERREGEKNIIVCIAEGSEEIETVSVIDVARRAGIQVLVAKITARSGTKLVADEHFATLYKRGTDALLTDVDMIVLPGGAKGAQIFARCKDLIELLRAFKEKSLFAAICASPAVVLAPNNLLDGIGKATCFPAMHDKLPEHIETQSKDERVVQEANLITSQGPGTAIDFALEIVERIVGHDKAKDLSKGLLVSWK